MVKFDNLKVSALFANEVILENVIDMKGIKACSRVKYIYSTVGKFLITGSRLVFLPSMLLLTREYAETKL